MNNKQHTRPLIIDGDSENQKVQFLEKVSLRLSKDVSKLYDEAWLQELIFNHPALLPIEEIEPAFFPLYPVCRELKTPAGYLDNLYVSENGSLTLVECKLWRNPEARREVVGQILDYAKEFANWSYEDLTEALKTSTGRNGNILFDVVNNEVDALDEALFVDSVSKNLSRGRFLVLIVGDGIREGVENISNFLQKHAGLDFTFGLVEMGIFKTPGEDKYIVQPRIIAKTYTIERAVIRTEGVCSIIEMPKDEIVSHKTLGKGRSISEEQFFEEFQKQNGNLVNEVISLIEGLKSIDINPVYRKTTLILHWQATPDLQMNFGCIYLSGAVDTFYTNWLPDKIGRISIGHEYQEMLSSLIQGSYISKYVPSHRGVFYDNKPVTIDKLIEIKDKWLIIIKETQKKILDVLN